jgi:hypothetical protein
LQAFLHELLGSLLDAREVSGFSVQVVEKQCDESPLHLRPGRRGRNAVGGLGWDGPPSCGLSSKAGDCLQLAVVADFEIGLRQVIDWSAFAVTHDDNDFNFIVLSAKYGRWRLIMLLKWPNRP